MILQAWRSMRPWARALVATIAAVIGLNVLISMVNLATGGSAPGGPTSSSYATGDDGLAAYAELLARRGHAVDRLRVGQHQGRRRIEGGVVEGHPQPVDGMAAAGQQLGVGGQAVAAGGVGGRRRPARRRSPGGQVDHGDEQVEADDGGPGGHEGPGPRPHRAPGVEDHRRASASTLDQPVRDAATSSGAAGRPP